MTASDSSLSNPADSRDDSRGPEYFVEAAEETVVIRKRKIEDVGMDITPMIDITFLLLIFFLVAAKLDEDSPVKLPPARHGTAVAVKGSAIITVAAGNGDQALVYTGDGKAAENLVGGADAEESAIVGYIEQQLSEGKEYVLIKAEQSVRHRDVARVASAVGKAETGGRDLYVAVLEIP